ncbi:MAG: hypothetical protein KatS3mg004_1865 [Bryobacteraceae bacterium]|nr:MAG: hypothetical protein KatS3mg004_1865 [Bryobacteraceae bacterium]
MSVRDRILLALLAAVAAAICWAAAEAALALRAWGRLPEDLAAEAAAVRSDLTAQVDILREDARAELAATRRDVLAQTEMALRLADQRLADAIERADNRTGEALAEAHRVSVSAASLLDEARAGVAEARAGGREAAARIDYWTDCERNGLCWQGAMTDTLLAGRRAALAIDRAMPQIVAATEASAAGVHQTAAASAQTAANLARLTQPGPRWLRYLGIGLSVAAPASQVALPFVVRRAELR